MLRTLFLILLTLSLISFANANDTITFPEQKVDWMPDPNLQHAVRRELKIDNDIPLLIPDLQRLYGLVSIGEGITNLQGLEHATNLNFLHIAPSSVSDLTPLVNLPNLKVLKLYENGLVDISTLTGPISLEELQLQNNQIVDISTLANLHNLRILSLQYNHIEDFTPLLELKALEILNVDANPGNVAPLLSLNLTSLGACDIEGDPTTPRVEDREYPSVFAAWMNIINMPTLSHNQRLTYHDLYFCCPMLGLYFIETEQGIVLGGNVEEAAKQREALKEQNPDLILLVAIPYFSGVAPDAYPEDSPLWLRDEKGVRVIDNGWNESLLDFTKPIVQNRAIQRAIAVSKCGLFDGIFFDHWNEDPRLQGYRTLEAEHTARDLILQKIRAEVDDDFLIMVNANHSKIPRWAPYVNGLFMETFGNIEYPQQKDRFESQGYTYAHLHTIETTLTWAETHLKKPRINGLEGFGISRQPPDSPANQRWMRVFTTMSLTHSDGYVLYNIGNASKQHSHTWNNSYLDQAWGHLNETAHAHDHDHYWYPFWDASLGEPIGEKAELYQSHEGLFIREFTNGWAVYNRSGKKHTVEFPEKVSGVASGVKDKYWHEISDLDGEIYLKPIPEKINVITVGDNVDHHDLNGDNVVNILDLVIIANAFGKDSPDLNGDNIVNILDLVEISNTIKQ